jgi:uncharacterized protein YraI
VAVEHLKGAVIMQKLMNLFLCGCVSTILLTGVTAAQESEDTMPLDRDMRALSVQISEAEKENSEHSEGLIKALIAYRLQVLKNTKAMLEQKEYASKHGIPVTYTYRGDVYKPTQADPTIIKSIESDIRHQEAELSKAEEENAEYSGGILNAMTLYRVATIKNTIAILEQQKLMEKYGIPVVLLPKDEFIQEEREEKKPTGTTVSRPEVPIWAVRVEKANIRGGPGTDYTKLFELKRFEEFEVIGFEGKWLNIRTDDRKEGWLHGSLAEPKLLRE